MNKYDLKQKVEEFLTRGVFEVIDKKHLQKRLLSGKKLRVKLGIDPTSPNLHLGRAVTLLKLRDLQEMGHRIIFIIGDFTGVIGDASDKESERPMLSKEKVKSNMQSYQKQVAKILDMNKAETRFNSEWLTKLGYMEISEQANQFSLAEFIARENIKKRLKEGKRISLREVLYPLMQGYDSVAVKADLEIGGTDQRFNLLAGRQLQKYFGQEPQDILTVNLIEGTDGRKMSSSWGNVINILDSPKEMFGKIMSIADDLIVKYLLHCTRIPMSEVKKIEEEIKFGKLNPRDAKLRLAMEIVGIYHSAEQARKSQEYFIQVFSERKIPQKIEEVKIKEGSISLIDFMVFSGGAKSKSEARRKIEQGGVEINSERVKDWKKVLNVKDNNSIFKIGKFHFVKIKFSK